MKALLPTLALWATALPAFSAGIAGQVVGPSGNALPFAVVALLGTKKSTACDSAGHFAIRGIAPGRYHLSAFAAGYRRDTLTLKVPEAGLEGLRVRLAQNVHDLEEVVIAGRSMAMEKSREAIAITALSTKEHRSKPMGTRDLLRRSPGVLVRQQGGLGSKTALNLNGLTGNAVRVYYDGIPLSLLGGGYSLNNLPLNLISRVEVYKGVMPISVGTDALGGGINLVPRRLQDDFLEASYQFGAFNTHRLSFVGRKSLGQGVVLGTNTFFNHSDNNYRMEQVPTNRDKVIEGLFGGLDTITVRDTVNARRFHNRHTSFFADASIKVYDKPWADELTLRSGFSHRFDQRQHGQRVTARPAGEMFTTNDAWTNFLRYEKTLAQDWQLNYFGNYTYSELFVNDSTRNLYNWSGGTSAKTNGSGSEILDQPSLRTGRRQATAQRLTLNYQLRPHHKISASNFFGYSRIAGKDPAAERMAIGGEQIDLNTIPAHYHRNIFGLESRSQWLKNEKLSTTLFYKHYWFDTRSVDLFQRNPTRLPIRKVSSNTHGYGAGIKYQITPALLARSSFERSTRLPAKEEIFGNFANILPNYTLQPERSNNYNLGLNYHRMWGDTQQLFVDLNGFFRQQEDLIRLNAVGDGGQSRYINEDQVAAQGLELGAKAGPFAGFSFQTNLTYQEIALVEPGGIQEEAFVGAQVPNIPDFFFNLGANYEIRGLFREADKLSAYWNYFFVDRFSVTYVLDEDQANPDNLVPQQHQHNIGFSYAPSAEHWVFGFQVNNLLDNRNFDNFRVPKPGIHYGLKISYAVSPQSQNPNPNL